MPDHYFSQTELKLLTHSSDEVQLNMPPVPAESAPLYPKLVSANWECYITADRVVLGRSPNPETVRSTNNAHSAKYGAVDIDFGPNKRDISRRHAEIRKNKGRWELQILGRNGAKVNHVLRRPSKSRSDSIILTTGSLIEIAGIRFVFVLPTKQHITTSSSGGLLREFDQDGRLETMITDVLKGSSRDTEAMVDAILSQAPSYDRDSVIHALILSEKFQLVDNQWSLRCDDREEQQQQQQQQQEQTTSPRTPRNIVGPSSSLGVSLIDMYTAWLDAQELVGDAGTPISTTSTISTMSSSNKRTNSDGIVARTVRESVKRQRSELVFSDPWRDVRTMYLLPNKR
ncbi:hypothetical protein BX666DRAFT_217894 [Dichotomocladium elegans]|nr:hypothetical protein BX666DRAFT_217894 [Dichotomocladium elegans]